jgi:hypothetical protein
MKITFGMIVLNGNQVLEECLSSVYPYAHQILIAEGPVKYWQEQGISTSNDGTNKILDSFPDPDGKIKIIHSQYNEKDDQCNAYMSLVKPDTDYIWNLDCDEIFKPEDIEKIIKLLQQERYTSVGFKSLTFYGGFDRYLTGFEERAEFIRIRKVYPGSFWRTHRPPTMSHIVPQNKRLVEKHLDYNTLSDQYGVRMYHYSYVFPDQVYNKIQYYEKFLNKQNTIRDYFNNVYLPWVLGGEKDKNIVEDKYLGVHEFSPHQRGECRTAPFLGQHPNIINVNIDSLTSKFKNQLKKYENI